MIVGKMQDRICFFHLTTVRYSTIRAWHVSIVESSRAVLLEMETPRNTLLDAYAGALSP